MSKQKLAMYEHYHAIYLSPHLDDVALSCGGQIAQRVAAGEQVLIVTIMAGDPPRSRVSELTERQQQQWGLPTAPFVARRLEDAAACRVLGADWLHWPLPECPYRLHDNNRTPFYSKDADLYGKIHRDDCHVIETVKQYLTQLPHGAQIFAPLAVGHHIDHQIVRLAAVAVWGDALYYYEEYPYAQKPGALTKVIGKQPQNWQPTTIPLTAEAFTAKIAAVTTFRSQLRPLKLTNQKEAGLQEFFVRGWQSSIKSIIPHLAPTNLAQVLTFFFYYLWHSESILAARLHAYARQIGGERIWQRQAHS